MCVQSMQKTASFMKDTTLEAALLAQAEIIEPLSEKFLKTPPGIRRYTSGKLAKYGDVPLLMCEWGVGIIELEMSEIDFYCRKYFCKGNSNVSLIIVEKQQNNI